MSINDTPKEHKQSITNIETNKDQNKVINNPIIILIQLIFFVAIDTLVSQVDFDLVESRISQTNSILTLIDITLFAITAISYGINLLVQFYKSKKIKKNIGIDNSEIQTTHKIKNKKSFNIFFGVGYSVTLIAFITHIIYLTKLLFSM